MPDGPIDGDTFASQSVGNATRVKNVAVPKDLLQVGRNRLSVEVHQVDGTSNDIVLGVELRVREQVTPFVPGRPYAESTEQWIELYNRSESHD